MSMTEQATTPPTTWKDRAVLELRELGQRHDALTAFLASSPSLPPEDMNDLRAQAEAMARYRASLSSRLARHGLAIEYVTGGSGLPDDWDRVPQVALYGAYMALDAASAAIDAMVGDEGGAAHNRAEGKRDLARAEHLISLATAALASGSRDERGCVGPWLRNAVAYALAAHEHAVYPGDLPHGIVPAYRR